MTRAVGAGVAILEGAAVVVAWLLIAQANAMPSESTGYEPPRGSGYVAGQALWALACAVVAGCLVFASVHMLRAHRSRAGTIAVWTAVAVNLLLAATLVLMTVTEPGTPVIGVLLTAAVPAACSAFIFAAQKVRARSVGDLRAHARAADPPPDQLP